MSKEIVYLNYAETSLRKHQAVIEAYNKVKSQTYSNRGQARLLHKSREFIALNLGVSEKHVYFTQGATHALQTIISNSMNPRDHCLFDNRSHDSVVGMISSLPLSIDKEMCPLYRKDETLLISP